MLTSPRLQWYQRWFICNWLGGFKDKNPPKYPSPRLVLNQGIKQIKRQCRHCPRCKTWKELDEFHKGGKRIRVSGWCKDCRREYGHEYYLRQLAEKPQEIRKQEKVRYLVKKALQHGTLVKPVVCSECGNIDDIQGHHENYDKPFDIVWLCRSCHRLHHVRSSVLQES